jgi:uncharacterized protein YkwD
MILRALGYASGVDFEWNRAWLLSDEIGITGGRYDSGTRQFLRGDVAEISLNALSARLKGSERVLASVLIDAGVFTEAQAFAAGIAIFEDDPVPLSEFPPMPEPEQVSAPSALDLEREVFYLVNSERAKFGLVALEWDATLAGVARAYSIDMSQRRFFSHICPDGRNPADRMRAAGFDFQVAGENLAMGHRTAEAVVVAWMDSPSHRDAILHSGPTRVGVGFHNNHWTMKLIG